MGIMRVSKIFFLFFLVSLLGFSQDENQNLESSLVIEFIEHKVKRKQTLYTITNLYDVPINLIKKYILDELKSHSDVVMTEIKPDKTQ